MTIRRRLTRWLAGKMNVPGAAIDMFAAAHDFSGLDTATLPSELIPLNTVTLARGLLNFAVLQASTDWVLPYWARRQYDPSDPAFLPRAHGGISINLTCRNWTALGEPGTPVESIVDPRGLLTPIPGSWSVDTWFSVDGLSVFPSALDPAPQRLLDAIPIVETELAGHGCVLTMRSFQFEGTLHHHAVLANAGATMRRCRLGFAIRPFNPEGVSLVREIAFDRTALSFSVDSRPGPTLSARPTGIVFSTRERGDVARHWLESVEDAADQGVRCDTGLATACAWYEFELEPGATAEAGASIPVGSGAPSQRPALEKVRQRWDEHHRHGATLHTPDERLNALFRSSLSTLLMLCDGTEVTPGPATYHQFWFRDAAYMIYALDKLGHHRLTAPIVRAFPDRQERSGMFRSQMGEWDSTGQALWTAAQHVSFSHSDDVLGEIREHLLHGVEWLERTRVKAPGSIHDGLLPPGLSAEHLGHVDFYFWDNFWSVAGLEAFLTIGGSHLPEARRSGISTFLRAYQIALSASMAGASRRTAGGGLPAGPGRELDAGMIGNVCMLYPLRLVAPGDGEFRRTLDTIVERFFFDGMFFQPFIHSGLNTYLTLQVAHALLWAGERERFWDMLLTVAGRATGALTFPEAIHPRTGGGVMGDGHHGWTAAEIVLAMRDACVYEETLPGEGGHRLVLLGGIPAEWLVAGTTLSLENCPVPGGTLSITCRTLDDHIALELDYEPAGDSGARIWQVRMPVALQRVVMEGGADVAWKRVGKETVAEIPPGSCVMRAVPASGARSM